MELICIHCIIFYHIRENFKEFQNIIEKKEKKSKSDLIKKILRGTLNNSLKALCRIVKSITNKRGKKFITTIKTQREAWTDKLHSSNLFLSQ